MLLDVWTKDRFAGKLRGRRIIWICEGKPFCSNQMMVGQLQKLIDSLTSFQEETDSRIAYCKYARDNGYSHVRVKSPNSDIFFILLHFSFSLSDLHIVFETGIGKDIKRLIDISSLARKYTHIFCTAFLSLHAFTGCDSVSCFKGIGKVKPWKV